MRGLILETSTERAVVAAFEGTDCLFQEQLPFGLQNSHFLLPALQQKIKGNVLKMAELDFVTVGIGPGSYTGIRVGVTIAKTLAFTLGIPLIGICTLDAFISEADGPFAAVIDAKIGGVYLQTVFMKKGVIESLIAPGAYSLEEAAHILEKIPTIVTPNAEKIRPKLEALKPGVSWEWKEAYPHIGRMNHFARQKVEAGEFGDDQSLELLYMRKTQAEIEKELKKAR